MDDKTLKVILLGDSGVGKTCLINRFIDNTYSEDNNQTVVGNASEVEVDANDKKVKLSIWDTAGQEKFKAITQQFYRDSNIAFVCFDCTDEDSAKHIDTWSDDIQKNTENCVLYLVATKLDLIQKNDDEQKTEEKKLDDFLNSKKSDRFKETFKTSAMDGSGVDDLFKFAAQEIDSINPINTTGDIIILKPDENKDEDKGQNNKKDCC